MPAPAPERPEPTGLLFDVMRFATHDGPGIRTTVFLKGCPLSCWWCHNPESQSFLPERLYYAERCRHCLDCAASCPEHAIHEVAGELHTSDACALCGHCAEVCVSEARRIAGRRHTVAELLAEVEKDLVFFDDSGGGVTLSGGEPASQPAFVAAFLGACRERGIRTAVETCGFAQPAAFRDAVLAADLVLFDLKHPDREKHRWYTGVDNDLILANLDALASSGRPYHLRVPVVPGVNDSVEDAEAFAALLGKLRPAAVELLPYHATGAEKYRRLGREYRLRATPSPAADDLAPLRDTLSKAGLHVIVGGIA